MAEVNPIVKQLADFCDCLEEVKESDVYELIDLISVYTCWAQNPCDTFLKADRREVVDLPNCSGDCDVFEFEPFYTPFEFDSFTFTLIEQNGIDETATPIDTFNYSAVDGKFRIELPLPDCKCTPKCGCESTFKLLVEYTAGFETIPACLLPIFCAALDVIHEKNDCDCEECEPCDRKYVETPDELNYTRLDSRLKEYFLETLSVQYRRQLALISLCRPPKRLWGFVV